MNFNETKEFGKGSLLKKSLADKEMALEELDVY